MTASSTALTPGTDHVSAVVQITGAVVSFGGRAVLHEVSATARPGELVVILGPNGSGKSTLVKAAVGLVPLVRGEVRLFGVPRRQFRQWRRVGYVPQRSTAATGVPATVGEVVASGRLSSRPFWRPALRRDREAVAAALTAVGLTDRVRDPVATLSGGQQQRVLIARALAARPEVLIMDEPMAGVDFAHQEEFAAWVGRFTQAGHTAVLVAHELGALEPLVDRAVILRAGRVEHDGPPIPGDPRTGHCPPEHPHQHGDPHHHGGPEGRGRPAQVSPASAQSPLGMRW